MIGRIKFDLPAVSPIFTTTLSVRITDLNYGNHLGNDRILVYAHEVRAQFLKAKNQSEADLFGKSLILADAAIMFKGEAFFGDLLSAEIYPGPLSAHGLDLYTRFFIPLKQKEIAWIKCGLVFFDYDKRQVTKAPENLNLLFH